MLGAPHVVYLQFKKSANSVPQRGDKTNNLALLKGISRKMACQGVFPVPRHNSLFSPLDLNEGRISLILPHWVSGAPSIIDGCEQQFVGEARSRPRLVEVRVQWAVVRPQRAQVCLEEKEKS